MVCPSVHTGWSATQHLCYVLVWHACESCRVRFGHREPRLRNRNHLSFVGESIWSLSNEYFWYPPKGFSNHSNRKLEIVSKIQVDSVVFLCAVLPFLGSLQTKTCSQPDKTGDLDVNTAVDPFVRLFALLWSYATNPPILRQWLRTSPPRPWKQVKTHWEA